MNDRKKNLSALAMLLFIRTLAKLPFKKGLTVGALLGSSIRFIAAKRRKITETNIRLCFPELSSAEQQQLVKDVFTANGIGLVETAWAHYGDKSMFDNRVEIVGRHLLDSALEQQRGVVLLGAHFSTLDLGGLLFSYTNTPLNTLYRQHNSPILDQAIIEGRSRYCEPIERKNMRAVVRKLKENQCVWFAPDQDLRGNGNVFATFFGQTASTVTATSNFVSFNNSPILMLAHYRKPDNSGYILEFSELQNCDPQDKAAFAQEVNNSIERAVRKFPAQYMWVHKRFKTQPDGKNKLYN